MTSRKKSPTKICLISFLVFILTNVLLYFFIVTTYPELFESQKKEPVIQEPEKPKRYYLPLPSVVVYLKNRRTMNLSLAVSSQYDISELISSKEYHIRDMLIKFMRHKTDKEVLSAQGKTMNKIEIAARLNEIFEVPVVRQVYYMEILIE